MTVSELIEKLQTVESPESTSVFIGGYEGGLHDISPTFYPEAIRLNVNDPSQWYYGPHEFDRMVNPAVQEVDLQGPVIGIIIT